MIPEVREKIEVEKKLLDVYRRLPDFDKKILELGGVLVKEEDITDIQYFKAGPDPRFFMMRSGGIFRLRKKTPSPPNGAYELALKKKPQQASQTAKIMLEREVYFRDRDSALAALALLGVEPVRMKYRLDKSRKSFDLNGVRLELDRLWVPEGIPPFLEFEASSEEAIISAARKLGLDYQTELTPLSSRKVQKLWIDNSDYSPWS